MIRIQTAHVLEGFRVQPGLSAGRVMERDLRPLLRGPVFEKITSDPECFRALRVEGGTLRWLNGADLCPDVLIWGGLPPEEECRPEAELHAGRAGSTRG